MTTGIVPGSTYLYLQGKTLHRPHPGRDFSALCGDEPPTIIDGYAKWTVIDRPLLQGVTVPQGFNPAKLKVSLRFGIWDGRFGFTGWDMSEAAGQEVEAMVDTLHWMAGGNALAGPSPIVYLKAFDTSRLPHSTNLVPKQYWGVAWVIDGGIEWGTSLRERHGNRIYQEATFTLMGYSSFPGPGTAPPRAGRHQSAGFFTTTTSVRTALAIATHTNQGPPEAFGETLAKKICTDPRNNPIKNSRIRLERRAITWKMPVGLHVWVPSRTF